MLSQDGHGAQGVVGQLEEGVDVWAEGGKLAETSAIATAPK